MSSAPGRTNMKSRQKGFLERLKGKRPLYAAIAALLGLGLAGVVWTRAKTEDVIFNISIEILGTAISVLLIEEFVQSLMERREVERRTPVFEVMERRLQNPVQGLVQNIKLLGVCI